MATGESRKEGWALRKTLQVVRGHFLFYCRTVSQHRAGFPGRRRPPRLCRILCRCGKTAGAYAPSCPARNAVYTSPKVSLTWKGGWKSTTALIIARSICPEMSSTWLFHALMQRRRLS